MGMQIEHFIQKGLSPKSPAVRLTAMNILKNTICKHQALPIAPYTPTPLLMGSWNIGFALFSQHIMCMLTSGIAQQEQVYSDTVCAEDQGPMHYLPKGYFRWAPGTDWRYISCSTSGMVLKHMFQFRFTQTELNLCALSPLCMVSDM